MEKTVILLAMVAAAALCGVGEAAVYIVGDSAGWTLKNAPNYTAWSLAKDFHVGDVLVFQYDQQYHNVMEVSKDDYLNCNGSSPIATYSTGNDSVTLDRRAHYFFICGFQGHCDAGQKFYVRTPKPASDAQSPAPSVPSPAPSTVPPAPAPSAPSTAPPAPSTVPPAPSTAPPALSKAPPAPSQALPAPSKAPHAPSTPLAEPAPAPAAPSASSPPPSAGGSTGTTPAAAPAPPKPSAATTTIHNALGLVAVFAAVSAGFLMH